MFSLADRVALVTGASQGLGLAMARGFALAGAQVLINSRDAARVQQAVEQLAREGLQALPLPFDVSDAATTEAMFRTIDERFGRLDILVNNVGNRLRTALENIRPEDFNAHLDVNLTAPFRLAKLAAPLMRRNAYGRIIMVTSVAGTLARAGDAAYISAKGGLTSLMRALACEFGPSGITCNAIAPGSFLTETNAELATGPVNEMIARRVPVGRWARPEEIAGPAVFLASEEASYVNGHVLTVDGGYSISF